MKDKTLINFPTEVGLFLKSTNNNFRALCKLYEEKGSGWNPPILLYFEYLVEKIPQTIEFAASHVGKKDKVSGRSTLAMIGHEIGLSERTSEDEVRRMVLNKFVKIDFCLDVLVCIELGVFDGNSKVAMSDLKHDLLDDNGIFSTTYKKIRYLRYKGMINHDTYKVLRQAKEIRNILVHQYMSAVDICVSSKLIKEYGNAVTAIEAIMNSAWRSLLEDYSKAQLKIVYWLDPNWSSNKLIS